MLPPSRVPGLGGLQLQLQRGHGEPASRVFGLELEMRVLGPAACDPPVAVCNLPGEGQEDGLRGLWVQGPGQAEPQRCCAGRQCVPRCWHRREGHESPL